MMPHDCHNSCLVFISAKIEPGEFRATQNQFKDNSYTYSGNILDGLGLGTGRYFNFKLCPDCGKIQSDVFPIREDIEDLDLQDCADCGNTFKRKRLADYELCYDCLSKGMDAIP